MIEIIALDFIRSERRIFKNLNLKVGENSKICVKGPIGSGKSTLFDLLLGFEAPASGQIYIGGKQISKKVISGQVNFIAQNSDLQLLTMEVEKEIEFISRKTITDEIIEFFQLRPFLKRNPLTLSSSEKRRVLLAGVFLSELPYLILDEPAADLDDQWKTKVFSRILESDKTVLAFSHEEIKGLEQLGIEQLQDKDPDRD